MWFKQYDHLAIHCLKFNYFCFYFVGLPKPIYTFAAELYACSQQPDTGQVCCLCFQAMLNLMVHAVCLEHLYCCTHNYTDVYSSLCTLVHGQTRGWLTLDKPAVGLRVHLFWFNLFWPIGAWGSPEFSQNPRPRPIKSLKIWPDRQTFHKL